MFGPHLFFGLFLGDCADGRQCCGCPTGSAHVADGADGALSLIVDGDATSLLPAPMSSSAPLPPPPAGDKARTCGLMGTCQAPTGLAVADYASWWAQLDQVLDSVLGETTPRVGQLELAPTTGRPHGQITFQLADKRSVGAVQKDLAKAAVARALACGFYLEARRGTQAEAAAYCTKTESAWTAPDGSKLLTWRVWTCVGDCSDG